MEKLFSKCFLGAGSGWVEWPQDPSPLRGTLASSLKSPAEGEGNEGFSPPPEKDLESPSSTRLEALVPPMTPEQ